MRFDLLARASLLAIAFSTLPAHAQEATNYQYDAQGRLTGSATGGGPNAIIGRLRGGSWMRIESQGRRRWCLMA